MRISDWSSDVCSSDLGGKADGAKAGGGAQARPCSGDRTGASETGCGAVPYAGGTAGRKPVDRKGSGSRGVRNLHQSGSPLDRKSVVLGKSVSVRVDPGGRSNIQKQKQQKNLTTTQHDIDEK